jgi:ABC-type multidrug transport system ATPase subunit
VAELSAKLEVIGLRKSYGPRRVLDVDFELEAGGFCLLLGENGAGKSTFFRCLLGLENFTGTVMVDGRKPRGSIFGILDQPMMYARWTAARNVRYLLNHSHADSLPLVTRLVDQSVLRRRAGQLSTGQKKIVLLAAGLAGDAEVVLLDEFANGLDQRARALFRDAVREQMAEGRSFIATGHDLHAFGDLPTRVSVMKEERVTDVAVSDLSGRALEEIYETYVGRSHP